MYPAAQRKDEGVLPDNPPHWPLCPNKCVSSVLLSDLVSAPPPPVPSSPFTRTLDKSLPAALSLPPIHSLHSGRFLVKCKSDHITLLLDPLHRCLTKCRIKSNLFTTVFAKLRSPFWPVQTLVGKNLETFQAVNRTARAST